MTTNSSQPIQTIIIQENTSTGEKKGFVVEVIEQHPDFSVVSSENYLSAAYGFEFYVERPRAKPLPEKKMLLTVVDFAPIQAKNKPYIYALKFGSKNREVDADWFENKS